MSIFRDDFCWLYVIYFLHLSVLLKYAMERWKMRKTIKSYRCFLKRDIHANFTICLYYYYGLVYYVVSDSAVAITMFYKVIIKIINLIIYLSLSSKNIRDAASIFDFSKVLFCHISISWLQSAKSLHPNAFLLHQLKSCLFHSYTSKPYFLFLLEKLVSLHPIVLIQNYYI